MDRRIHGRRVAKLPVRVTELSPPGRSLAGQTVDISESGIGVDLPVPIAPGGVVQLDINDCVLFGFVAHATLHQSGFRAGIEVVQVLIGTSGLAQLLRATLEEAM